jgi:hypothetical protein
MKILIQGYFSIDYIHKQPSKELVTRELLIFRCYQVDPKNIKCFFQWWGKHETMFPIVDLLAYQILSIVGSQIEIEKKNSFGSIFTNLKRCHL